MITISLCMIVKNEEKNLSRCLDCLKDIMDEIIIVDTGSTDHTKQIASKYANVNVVYVYIEAPSIQECINRRGGGKWIGIINKMWSSFEFPDKSECNKLVMIKQ